MPIVRTHDSTPIYVKSAQSAFSQYCAVFCIDPDLEICKLVQKQHFQCEHAWEECTKQCQYQNGGKLFKAFGFYGTNSHCCRQVLLHIGMKVVCIQVKLYRAMTTITLVINSSKVHFSSQKSSIVRNILSHNIAKFYINLHVYRCTPLCNCYYTTQCLIACIIASVMLAFKGCVYQSIQTKANSFVTHFHDLLQCYLFLNMFTVK